MVSAATKTALHARTCQVTRKLTRCTKVKTKMNLSKNCSETGSTTVLQVDTLTVYYSTNTHDDGSKNTASTQKAKQVAQQATKQEQAIKVD
jgi:hypothetical protein